MKNYNDRLTSVGAFVPAPGDDTIICRCEEVSQGEIRKAVYQGFFHLTEIKRYLRTGMGLCQGSRCGNLVRGIVARELGVPPKSIDPPSMRTPMRPTAMQILANEIQEEG